MGPITENAIKEGAARLRDVVKDSREKANAPCEIYGDGHHVWHSVKYPLSANPPVWCECGATARPFED